MMSGLAISKKGCNFREWRAGYRVSLQIPQTIDNQPDGQGPPNVLIMRGLHIVKKHICNSLILYKELLKIVHKRLVW
jgi:hypothetical protein